MQMSRVAPLGPPPPPFPSKRKKMDHSHWLHEISLSKNVHHRFLRTGGTYFVSFIN